MDDEKEPRTFRVMDSKGNTLNFVETASTEKDSDTMETRVEKRRIEANKKCQQWMQTVYRGEEVLKVVGCGPTGKPLSKPA